MKVERVVRAAQPIVGVHDVVCVDNLSDFCARAFVAALGELSRLRMRPTGAPVALYSGDVTEKVDVIAGFPVASAVDPKPGFVAASLPGGQTVEAIHRGTYDEMGDTYDALLAWLEERDLVPLDQTWEEYVVGPDTEGDPARWCTRIVYPLV
jgi:effector-binding domain-containing protein